MHCPVCQSASATRFRVVAGVDYFECIGCGSVFADPNFLSDVERNKVANYHSGYWDEELAAARERSFGSSLARVAETFLYSRIPIQRFVDIGSGPGYLLDALRVVMPASADRFYGVELFPPAKEFCSTHPNFVVGTLESLPNKFEAGTCIEVIEHLTPGILRNLIQQLASRSTNGALYYFGSGQPTYVKQEDPDYLDPFVRGHIMSYSVAGIEPFFREHGFTLIPLPGRTWAFLVEYGESDKPDAEQLLSRVWTASSENIQRLKDPIFGPLMYSIGVEAARCYLENAICLERTAWAQDLDTRLTQANTVLEEQRRLQEQLKVDDPHPPKQTRRFAFLRSGHN